MIHWSLAVNRSFVLYQFISSCLFTAIFSKGFFSCFGSITLQYRRSRHDLQLRIYSLCNLLLFLMHDFMVPLKSCLCFVITAEPSGWRLITISENKLLSLPSTQLGSVVHLLSCYRELKIIWFCFVCTCFLRKHPLCPFSLPSSKLRDSAQNDWKLFISCCLLAIVFLFLQDGQCCHRKTDRCENM